MKKIIKNISLATLFSLALISCSNDDNATGDSSINFTAPTASYSSLDGTDVTIQEMMVDADNGMSYAIQATLSEAVQVDTHINLVQTGGTATEGQDFSLSSIIIPALATTGQGTVTIYKTGDVEEDETLEVTAQGSTSAGVTGDAVFNYTITDDYINGVLDLELIWEGSYTDEDSGISIDYCAVDFDLLLFDDAFGYIGYVLGTAACPEVGSISGLDDGTYYLVSDLYSNPFAAAGISQPMPLTLNYSQEHFPMTIGSIVNNNYFTDSDSGLTVVATLVVTNGYEYMLN